MQIVIDIPEEDYKGCAYFKNVNPGELSNIELAVANGTLLPKGHGDLIDASKIIHATVYNGQYEEWEDREMTILDFVNTLTDEGITEAIIKADRRATMQIVIDITEDTYNFACDKDAFLTPVFEKEIRNAIQSGILLPKGHGRLIDADKVLNELKSMKVTDKKDQQSIRFANIILENTSAIIEAEKEDD